MLPVNAETISFFVSTVFSTFMPLNKNCSKVKKRLLIITGLLICQLSFLIAQINVIHVNNPDNAPSRNGIFYSLPRTVLKIDVVVRVEENLKGPCSEYAEKFLGMEEVINFDYTSYFIGEVYVTTSVEPDPAQIYFIEPGERESKDYKPLSLKLDKNGFLVAANNLDDVPLEAESQDENVFLLDATESSFSGKFLVREQIRKKRDTIIRRVTVDTALTEQLFFRNRIIEKSNEELALEALEKIEQLREARYLLLTGFQETAYESGTVKYMDRQLHGLENEYLDLFRGKSSTSYEHHTFYFTPENTRQEQSLGLFRFSGSAGVLTGRGGAGEEVVLKIEPLGHESTVEKFPQPPAAESNRKGIAYRIPGTGRLTISIDKETIHSETLRIHQLGVAKRLPAKRFSVTLHPETGGIQSLKMD